MLERERDFSAWEAVWEVQSGAVSGESLSERGSGKRSGEVGGWRSGEEGVRWGGGWRACGLLPVEGLVGYRRLEPA